MWIALFFVYTHIRVLYMLYFSAKILDFAIFAPLLFKAAPYCFGNQDLTPGSSLCWAVWWWSFVGGHTCDPHRAPLRCSPPGTVRGATRRTRVPPAKQGKVKNSKIFSLLNVQKGWFAKGVLHRQSDPMTGSEWNFFITFMRKLKRKIDFLGLFSVKSFTRTHHQSCTAHDRAVFHPLPGHFHA